MHDTQAEREVRYERPRGTIDERRAGVRSFDEPQPLTPTDEVLSRAGDAMNAAMSPDAKAPVPQLHLTSYDGDVVRGSLIAGYKVRLQLDGDHGVLELPFPSAERAEGTAEELREAIAIVNRALRYAHGTFTEPLPEPVDCRHRVRIEQGEEGEQIAVCRNCTTIIVHDVHAWAVDHQEQIASRGLQTITSAIDYFARGR